MTSPSPRRTLSRLRRKLESGNDSSPNLASGSENGDEQPADDTLQPTLSTESTRLRDRLRRKSVDDRPDSRESGSKLSVLLRNKLKRNSSSDHLPNSSFLSGSGNHSTSSLGQDDSGHSSLLTDDDSDHGSQPTRPPLSTHNSHAGYLTLSAPDIQSQASILPTDLPSTNSAQTRPASQSAPSIPQIVEPYDIEPLSGAAPPERSSSTSDRSKSAGGITSHKYTSSVTSTASAPEPGVASRFEERPRVNTEGRPQTPTNLVETPTTYVTPPTPTDPNADAPAFPRKALQKASPSSSRTGSPSYDTAKGRRINLPSKLANSIPAPLTPTAEEAKTPGGTLTQPTNATGFFSSVFTAAQKAADTLSNTIQAPGAKAKPASTKEADGGEEVIPGADSRSSVAGAEEGTKQPAVDTLGSGSLSLRHLGIGDSQDPSPMNSSHNLPLQNGATHAEDEAKARVEEEAAARAVSEAYQEPVHPAVKEIAASGRPLSIASNERISLAGDRSPPRSTLDGDSVKRSGSVLSGRRRRRRGTSATAGTGTTIAAGLSASASGLGNLSVNGTGHRLTGFAVASNKRNKDFHQLFRSVPEDDYLIEDYSAALQRDILLHGRLYVSEGHICFASNILGWVTNLVISFDEVTSMEKKSTAVIFPNAIVISTQQARNTFASFVARDSTYELLIGIWKISHPNLKSSLNGVTLDNEGTGDKTEVADPDGSDGASDTGSEDEVYDEDADGDGASFEDATLAPSIAGSDTGERTLSRQPSNTPVAPNAPQANGAPPKGLENSDAAVTGAAVSSDFPGPATHEPTQCSDGADHYEKPLIDVTIPAPLGKIYSMIFGPASITFMRKWHVEEQKSRDLHFSDTPLDNDHKTITFDYIKPLNAPVGPKQTKCITTYTLVAFDLEKAVSVDCSTQTPDVPSGSVFVTKTRYCLTWGPENSTRLVANCIVEWTGKSWLKGPIEKGANDGQIEFTKSLVAALRAAVSSKPPVKGVAKKGKRKGKKEIYDAEEANAQREATVAAEQQASDWGMLEPIHGLLRPFIAIFSPFLTSQTIIAVLFVLLLYTWINPPARKGGNNLAFPGTTSPQRLAAYEEIWRREESNLWDWLENRVGLEGVYAPSLADGSKGDRQRVLTARDMGKRLENERLNDRQVDEAIRVTEGRLQALKEAVARKKEKGSTAKA